jgi:hypothetical protein
MFGGSAEESSPRADPERVGSAAITSPPITPRRPRSMFKSRMLPPETAPPRLSDDYMYLTGCTLLAGIVVAFAVYRVINVLTVHIPKVDSTDGAVPTGVDNGDSIGGRMAEVMPALGTISLRSSHSSVRTASRTFAISSVEVARLQSIRKRYRKSSDPAGDEIDDTLMLLEHASNA